MIETRSASDLFQEIIRRRRSTGGENIDNVLNGKGLSLPAPLFLDNATQQPLSS
jgi:hypothetical protein